MADFNITYPIVIKDKDFFITTAGEYVYKGIGRKSNPNWSGWKTVDEAVNYYGKDKSLWYRISIDLNANTALENSAKSLYFSEYWNKMRLSEFTDQVLSTLLFDFGTFRGMSAAIKALKIALNGLGSKLTVTGTMDTETIAAANQAHDIKLYSAVNALYGRSVPQNVNAAVAITDKTEDITTPQGSNAKWIIGGIAVAAIIAFFVFKNKSKKSKS